MSPYDTSRHLRLNRTKEGSAMDKNRIVKTLADLLALLDQDDLVSGSPPSQIGAPVKASPRTM